MGPRPTLLGIPIEHKEFVFQYQNGYFLLTHQGGKSPHAEEDTWMISHDFPPGVDMEEFKVNGGYPSDGHLGMVCLHLVQTSNPFVPKALAFVEYLKSDKVCLSILNLLEYSVPIIK